ncbi:hypothetical protein [Rivularia sp. UHCC 0363]|uniref:hypothetical protein n=1 Tax=Rivularia sp. UHCC 0363 TaxID=3110244 RepID=UPI002B210CA5|nr:hypothetical protein [Rivularia sp. UHCC 0363]MEA5596270.1 hypothetical protein [Rivularia sp. UHCC 0363]
MKVVKKTASLLVLSDLKQVRNRRKFSFRLLILNLLIMGGFFWVLSGSDNLKIKLSLILFTLVLLIPGILLIRFDTSESNYFAINTNVNKFIHKRMELFANKVYIAEYPLRNIRFIGIKRNSLNRDDDKNYLVRLYFKSNKYVDIGYFATSQKSFKIAKTISKFLKIPLKY